MARQSSAPASMDSEDPENLHSSRAGRIANYVLDNVIGVHSGSSKRFVDHLRDSRSDEVMRAEEARNEHVRPGATTSYKSSFGLLAERFGEGVFQYFDFIVFLTVTNAIILVGGVISMIPHFYYDTFVKSNLQKNFYILAYTDKSYRFWWWPTVITCGMILLTFGPAIALRISIRFKKKHIVDYEDEFDMPTAVDVIKDKTGLAANPPRKQLKRFLASYLLFLLLLGVSGVLTMGFVAAQYYAFNNTFAASLLVSVIVTVLNSIWTQVCTGLTMIEAHYTWTEFKNHHTLKLFIWKIMNVSLMFLGQWLVTNCYLKEVPIWAWIFNLSATSAGGIFGSPSSPSAPTAAPVFTPPPSFNSTQPTQPPSTSECARQCELGNLGNQFITLLIVDLFLGNFIRLAWPWFGWKLYGCCTRKHTSAESEDGRIEFDLALNYLDLLYRQFIVYLGTPFVPFLPALGVIINLIQIPVDKWRLLKWCKTPPHLSGSMKHFLIFFLLISALVSIAVFPYGTGWILANFTLRTTCPTTVFGRNSNATIS